MFPPIFNPLASIDNSTFKPILNIQNDMQNTIINKVIQSGRDARKTMDKMTALQKRKLESTLDVEHAYYSSALEGSRIDEKSSRNWRKRHNLALHMITRPEDKGELQKREAIGVIRASRFVRKFANSKSSIDIGTIQKIHAVIFQEAWPEVAGVAD
jgi:hypothetical protein